jgi:DNA-binding beta-propeller fold protein YncE
MVDLSFEFIGTSATSDDFIMIMGMDMDPVNQQIYAISFNDNGVYTVDPQNGQITLLSSVTPISFGGTDYDIVFNETTGALYFSSADQINGSTQGILAEYDLNTNTANVLMGLTLDSFAAAIALPDSEVALSVNDVTVGSNDIKMYPNPVTNNVLNISNNNSNIYDLKIYSIQGQLVLESTINTGINTLNTSNLSSGVYVVKFKNGNKINSRKLIIK